MATPAMILAIIGGIKRAGVFRKAPTVLTGKEL
jgi:hypothetical protein